MGERNQILKEAIRSALKEQEFPFKEEYQDETTFFVSGIAWDGGDAMFCIPCHDYGMPELSLRAVLELPISPESTKIFPILMVINKINQQFPLCRVFLNDENDLVIAVDYLIYGNSETIRKFVDEQIDDFSVLPMLIQNGFRNNLMKLLFREN